MACFRNLMQLIITMRLLIQGTPFFHNLVTYWTQLFIEHCESLCTVDSKSKKMSHCYESLLVSVNQKKGRTGPDADRKNQGILNCRAHARTILVFRLLPWLQQTGKRIFLHGGRQKN